MTLPTRRNTIFKGAVLAVAMRWTDRFIGLVSTLILARLLAPEDFGIVAIASLVIGFIAVFLDLGVNVALIQRSNLTKGHYDTAWTMRLLQGTATALLVAIGAPLAGSYFDDPRIVPVLQLLSLNIVISAIENIGVVEFQKKMEFGLDFRFMFAKRVSAFAATIGSAFVLQDYWALVIGTLVGRTIGTLISYLMHPMRPRFSLETFLDIFSVSQWMLFRSIGAYLDGNLHKILVGGRTDPATVGAYTLGDEIAAMPSTELLAPINRALFPAFAAAKDNLAELKRLFLLTQGLQTLIGIPAGVGLAIVAPEAVAILLGEKWHSAIPFVQILALTGATQAITTSSGYLLITLDRISHVALLAWVQVAIFAVIAIAFVPHAGAIELAGIRLFSVFFGFSLILWQLLRALPTVSVREIAQTIARPLLASAAMAGVLHLLDQVLAVGLLPILLTKIVAGATTYTLAIFTLWATLGRPEGAESYALGKLKALIAVRRKGRGA